MTNVTWRIVDRKWKIILLILVYSATKEVASVTDDIFLVRPSNTAIAVGKPLKLECGMASHATSLQWNYKSSTDVVRSTSVYNGETIVKPFQDIFTVDTTTKERCNLESRNTTLKHSGIYECRVTETHVNGTLRYHTAEAHLIVLGSDPDCSVNKTVVTEVATKSRHHIFRFCCHLNYSISSRWIAVMTWFKQGEDRILNATSSMKNQTDVLALDSCLATYVTSSDKNVTITCMTKFTSPAQADADNLLPPDYIYQYNFTDDVKYGPCDLHIYPVMESYVTGSRLWCTADANPPPEYEWKDVETSIVTSGPELTIKKKRGEYERDFVYECTAINLVKGERMSISKRITVKLKGTYVIQTITIALGISCFLLVIVIVCLVRNHLKVVQTSDDNSGPDIVPADRDGNVIDEARRGLLSAGYLIPAEFAPGGCPLYEEPGRAAECRGNEACAADDDDECSLYAQVNKGGKLRGQHNTNNTWATTTIPNCVTKGSDGKDYFVEGTTCLDKKMGTGKQSNRYVGADGTEYLELNSVANANMHTSVDMTTTELDDDVLYATIDHTMRPPLQPPKKY